jgi:hypothetical protein
LPPVPAFVGNLAPNNRLQKATYLAENQIRGPETLQITSDGTIYTGLANGEVVSISLDGKITKIAFIGDVTNETICSKSNLILNKLHRFNKNLAIDQ